MEEGGNLAGVAKEEIFIFVFIYFFFEVGNGLDGAEMVVCGDEGKYLKKILFPGRECPVACVRIIIRMYNSIMYSIIIIACIM